MHILMNPNSVLTDDLVQWFHVDVNFASSRKKGPRKFSSKFFRILRLEKATSETRQHIFGLT